MTEEKSDINAIEPSTDAGIDMGGANKSEANTSASGVSAQARREGRSFALKSPTNDEVLLNKSSETLAQDSRLTQFAFNLADYTHDSWYAHWEFGELMLKMKLHSRAKESVSIEIMRILRLKPEMQTELDTSNIRELALLDGQQLRLLVWRLGLASGGGEFKSIVDGNQIRDIIKAIGLSSFELAVKNAGRIVTTKGNEYKRTPSIVDEINVNLKKNLILNGLAVLAILCVNSPANISRRMLLKLPYLWAAQCPSESALELDESIFALLAELLEMGNST